MDYLSLENLDRLRGWINGFEAAAPIIFIAAYAVAVVAFLPATPLTLLAGLVFGGVWGTLWATIGATIGTTLAFVVGRYAAGGWLSSGKRTMSGSGN